MEVLNCFNKHFILSGSLSDSVGPVSVKLCTDLSRYTGQPFNSPFSVQEVHKAFKALKAWDHRKSPGPDLIDSYFLKPATDFVAEPLTNHFKSHSGKEWNTFSVVLYSVLKGVDPAILTNYRPISNPSVLANILEALVSEQATTFLHSNAILRKYQSGFGKKKT